LLGVQKIGRYEVLSHLASGGMGQVYLARSTGLGGFERQVVVKTLDLSITDDDDAFVTMFLDEARLVGALHHQYIAPVYEVGCDEDGCYYLVMDYVHGETAEAVYRAAGDRKWPVPQSFAITVVSCVASALDYAHNLCAEDGTPLDIVHRDISLSNVMVGYDGAVKLIDFGIAKASNRATKTQVGTLKGKIGYLAPEQILRKDVDHRADIFALGIVLYELTTGTRAFRETSDLVTLERITNGDIRIPSSFLPDYPPELEAIVLRALQVDPDQRFQDAGAMGRELEGLAARISLPLGHAAVSDVMTRLFGEQRRGRRRMARGSNEPQTDRNIRAIDHDDPTPVMRCNRVRRRASARSSRRPRSRSVPIRQATSPGRAKCRSRTCRRRSPIR
jgi:eukaryotic-like serine/threonine-protein kinase